MVGARIQTLPHTSSNKSSYWWKRRKSIFTSYRKFGCQMISKKHWLVINGFYMFHHGTVDKVSDTNKEREEDPPFLQARRGYAWGGMAIHSSPRATEAWKHRAGQHDPIVSENILGCVKCIALPLHFIDYIGKKNKINACSFYHPPVSANRNDQNFQT